MASFRNNERLPEYIKLYPGLYKKQDKNFLKKRNNRESLAGNCHKYWNK